MRNCFRPLFGIAWLFALAGCSTEGRPVRQRGIVTLEGRPLAGFTVTFMSMQDKRPAWGVTDEDGRFELMTYDPKDGCLPGEYKIVLSSPSVGICFSMGLILYVSRKM